MRTAPIERDAGKTPFRMGEKLRPEVEAGGILRDDGEIHYYTRINALLRPDMVVLDFGAGRGHVFLDEENSFRSRLAKLQGKVARVIGVDADEGILKHPFLDERHIVRPDEPLPVADGSIDLITAHWVLEHIDSPEAFAKECSRILKPGGWLCARTPHRWGYVGLFGRMAPESAQRILLRRIKPGIEDQDKFHTSYKLNTLSALRRYFPPSEWKHFSYGYSATPRYHFNSEFVFRAFELFQRLSWPPVDIMILIQKRA